MRDLLRHRERVTESNWRPCAWQGDAPPPLARASQLKRGLCRWRRRYDRPPLATDPWTPHGHQPDRRPRRAARRGQSERTRDDLPLGPPPRVHLVMRLDVERAGRQDRASLGQGRCAVRTPCSTMPLRLPQGSGDAAWPSLSLFARLVVPLGLHQFFHIVWRERRPVDGERQLVELTGEAERGLVVLVVHRRLGVRADVEVLVPL